MVLAAHVLHDDRSWFIEVERPGARGILKRKLTAIFKPFVQATGRRGAGRAWGWLSAPARQKAMGGTNRHQYASCWQLFFVYNYRFTPNPKQKCVPENR